MKDRRKKFYSGKSLRKICVYTVLTTAVCAVLVRMIWNWDDTVSLFSGLLSSLSPFLIGFLLACIMGNLSSAIETHLFTRLFHMKKTALRRTLALITAYATAFIAVTAAFFFIIPALIKSIADMAGSLTGLYNTLVDDIASLSEKFSNPAVEYIQQTVKDSMPRYIEMFRDWAAKLAPGIASASVSIVKGVFNFFVAIIVSVYMLLDKKRLCRNLQRIIYSVFRKDRARYIWSTLKRANNIFSGFIIGKSLDSLIIGVLCLILMRLFNIGGSYALIISIFVGITNMIPYFGPFIGAVPSAVIIFLSVSPKQALAFVILIIVLQQFDGNILGPYILGDKTGLRPIWIIFAITIGGWLGGVTGMFLGVPTVAVISSVIDDMVDRRLSAKGIDLPAADTASPKKPPKKSPGALRQKIASAFHRK